MPTGLFLGVGPNTVTGPGGADVGPFEVKVEVPTGFTWTNKAATNAVTRSQGVNVT